MKGYLKYFTSDMPEDSQMRAPSIVVLSKKYTNDNVDVWHCPPTKAIPILTRTKSIGLLERRRDLLLGGFGESGSAIHKRRGRLSLSEIDVRRGGDDTSDVDPGPSISEVGKEEVDRRGSVVMDAAEFSNVLRNVIISVKNSDVTQDVIVDDKGNVVMVTLTSNHSLIFWDIASNQLLFKQPSTVIVQKVQVEDIQIRGARARLCRDAA
ncbi:hypothetical protein CsSME_00041485 [Camellia sinensis var. sinensis]